MGFGNVVRTYSSKQSGQLHTLATALRLASKLVRAESAVKMIARRAMRLDEQRVADICRCALLLPLDGEAEAGRW